MFDRLSDWYIHNYLCHRGDNNIVATCGVKVGVLDRLSDWYIY